MGKNQNPIDAAIDKACGFTKEDMDVMAENVAVGKKVREIATVCEEFAKTLTTRQRGRFWSLIRDRGIMEVGVPPEARFEIVPMKDKRAEAFLAMLIPFGKYAGKTIKEVEREDPHYLSWLADNSNDFQKLLKQYLARSKYKGL